MKYYTTIPPISERLSHVSHVHTLLVVIRGRGLPSIWCIGLLLIGFFCTSPSITPAQQIRFKRTTVQQGLSQSSIQAMCQDRRGFLWFGTQNGLNCYDGYTMTVYRTRQGDSTALPDNYILSLYEDRSGTLWIGTLGGGVARMNPYSRRFTTISMSGKQARTYSNSTFISEEQSIFALTEDLTGKIWLGVGSTLLRLNPITNLIEERFSAQNSLLQGGKIRALFTDGQGNIWVGTEKGLFCYNPTQSQWTALGHTEGLPDKNIRAFAPDNLSTTSHALTQGLAQVRTATQEQPQRHAATNILWIGTASSGVYRLDCVQKRITSHISAPMTDAPVQAISVGVGGLLWVAYAGEGLQLVNTYAGTSTLLRHHAQRRESLSHNAVLSLLTDRSHTLWVGTDGAGLCYFNSDEYRFEFISNDDGSGTSIVMSMLEDKQGNIWFGTLADGLHLLNLKTGAITNYKHDPQNPRSLSSNFVWALAEDRAGTLWVGTNGGGLCRFDRVSGVFTRYNHDEHNPASLPHNSVYSILESSDGTLWVATGGGLAVLNRQTGTFTTFRKSSSPAQAPSGSATLVEGEISSNAVRALYESKRGVLWVGTRGGGLNRFEPGSRTFTVFRHNASNSNSISSDEVSSIREDAKGILWVGTANGLNRFDPASGSFSAFKERSGLPSSYVYSVIDDSQGYIWLTTGKGISRFNPQNSTFNTFEEVSHRAGMEFNQDACFKDRSGYIYFGSVAGFVRFHPDSVQINYLAPPIVLTSFKKSNKVVALDTIISEKRELHLSVDDSFIAFEFAALSFSLPEKIRYFCKLENFDNDWIDLGTKREVTYTNLEAGEYILHVRSTNYDGIRGEEGATLRIIIHPHWWQTYWAKIGAGVLLLICGFGAYKLRVRAIEARQQELERTIAERTAELSAGNKEITRQNEVLLALNTEKNEFLGIAAHDLKSPLTSIILSSSIVQQYQSRMTVQEISEQMAHILITARRMQETILNLLDINAIESGRFKFSPIALNIVEVVNDIVEGYYLRAQDKQLTLHFNHEADEIMMMCDRNALMQILENLISNAIKYSPHGKNVFVSIMTSENSQMPTLFTREADAIEHLPMSERSVRVEIQDEGPGLSTEDKALLFQKFAKLSSKPTGGEHSTGLGLSIVKKITEAMGGRVWCESELGQGATFTVELPIVEVSQEDLNERLS